MDTKTKNTANTPEGEKSSTGGADLTVIPSAKARPGGGVGGVTVANPAQGPSGEGPSTAEDDWAGWRIVGSKKIGKPTEKEGRDIKRETLNAKRNMRRKRAIQRARSMRLEGGGPENQAHTAAASAAAPTTVTSGGATKPTAKSVPAGRPGMERSKGKGKDSAEGQANAKRVRPNETFSPKVNLKRQKLNQTRGTKPTSYAAAVATSGSIEVAVTTEARRFISRETATRIEEFLVGKIDEIASGVTASSPSNGPLFRGRPTYREGSLRLICEDERSVQWVINSVEKFEHPERITALRPEEIPRRVHIGIVLPGLESDLTRVGRRLFISNPWADVQRWLAHGVHQQEKHSATFVTFSIPEDLVMEIMARERRLVYLLGSVYVKFKNPKGRYVSTPPGDEESPEPREVQTSTPKKGLQQSEGASTSTQPAQTTAVTEQMDEEELLAGVEMELGGEECQDGVIPF